MAKLSSKGARRQRMVANYNSMLEAEKNLAQEGKELKEKIEAHRQKLIDEFGEGTFKAGASRVISIMSKTVTGNTTVSWKGVTEDIVASAELIKVKLKKKGLDKKAINAFYTKLMNDFSDIKERKTKKGTSRTIIIIEVKKAN